MAPISLALHSRPERTPRSPKTTKIHESTSGVTQQIQGELDFKAASLGLRLPGGSGVRAAMNDKHNAKTSHTPRRWTLGDLIDFELLFAQDDKTDGSKSRPS